VLIDIVNYFNIENKKVKNGCNWLKQAYQALLLNKTKYFYSTTIEQNNTPFVFTHKMSKDVLMGVKHHFCCFESQIFV